MWFRAFLIASVALASIATGAHAEIVYDSSSVYQWGTPNPVATSGFNDNITTHPTQPYLAQQVVEVGGHISLAGTERTADTATIQMRTGPNGSAAVAGTIAFSLNFYTSLGDVAFATDTITVDTPAGSGDTKTTQRPFYNITFDLAALGIQLPDSFYYGLSFDPTASVTANSTNISLWNYGTADGYGPTDSDYDGPAIKVGTDLDHQYWTKSTTGAYSFTDGFTPNLTIEVPEPSTRAVLIVGLLGLSGLGLVRRQRAGLQRVKSA